VAHPDAGVERVYLDYNCFQRGFDDPRQVRIQMERLACQEIFFRAQAGGVELVWSFMHEDETVMCPFPERKQEALRLATLCTVRIGPTDEIRQIAESFQARGGLSAKDAVHLACASSTGARFFVTCDDVLLRQSSRLSLGPRPLNPVDYVRLEVHRE